jgi:hypothetical protein
MLEALEGREVPSTVVYTVTNTSGNQNVQGSLPWAVVQADTDAYTLHYIIFNIPGPGVHVININQTLFVSKQTVIDGTSQPGYVPGQVPHIYVDGNSSVPSLILLTGNSSGSVIQGLGLSFYYANAVTVFTSSEGNTIQNNWIGFFPAATPLLTSTYTGNNTAGVGLLSSWNVIRDNVISGTYNAIIIGPNAGTGGPEYVGNVIQSNLIGTDPTGLYTAGYGNQESGVFLGNGAHDNYIGSGNVLTGNAYHGVEMLGPDVIQNFVFGNLIGTNSLGNWAIGSSPVAAGVVMGENAGYNVIGGPWGGNVISGNPVAGVIIGLNGYGGSYNNYVEYNTIGLNAAQSAVIGSEGVGVWLETGSSGNVVQSNTIAGMTNNAVILDNASYNSVSYNWIGEVWWGWWFGNADYAVALLDAASYNWIIGNAFGYNGLGWFWIGPNAVGNVT